MSFAVRFRSFLKPWIKKRRNITDVSRAVTNSKDKSWLSRALSGERPITLERIEKIFEATGNESQDFWLEWVSAEVGTLPPSTNRIRLLDRALDSTDGRPEILERVREVAPGRLIGEIPLVSLERFEAICGLLQENRRVALAEAETWLLERWSYGLRTRIWPDSAKAELAVALAAWAAVTRALGNVADAVLAIKMAHEIHGHTPCGVSYGPVLETMAVILRDLNHIQTAFECLQEALSIYSIFGDEQGWLRSMMALGVFAAYRDQPSVAENAFGKCVEHPGATKATKLTAVSNLAWVAQQYDRLDLAKAVLENLGEAELAALPARIQANVHWVKAKILKREGGTSSLESSLEILERLDDEPSDFALSDRILLHFDLVEALVRLGRHGEATERAAAICDEAKELEGFPLVEELIHEFIRGFDQITGQAVGAAAREIRDVLHAGAAATASI